MKPETHELIRRLRILETGCQVPLTLEGHQTLVRQALAGEPIVTPLEAFIFMGGQVQDFSPQKKGEYAKLLRKHGYVREKIALSPSGGVAERYVRHEEWPEDAYWDEQLEKATERMMDRIAQADIGDI